MSAISVIIPVYNDHKYLKKTIECLENQSLRDIEIIVASINKSGSLQKTIEKLVRKYGNIKYIAIAAGGFIGAYIAGFKASSARYVAYVNIGDKVSFDWCRVLFARAVESNADLVIGQALIERGGHKEFYNLDPLRRNIELHGGEIIGEFMRQRGCWEPYVSVCNKLYRRDLLADAYADLSETLVSAPKLEHFADTVFSVALWCRAKKVCNVTFGADYFSGTVNANDRVERQKTKSGERDFVFRFMENQLSKYGLFEECSENFSAWKQNFTAGQTEHFFDDFLYRVTTPINKRVYDQYGAVKELICSRDIEVVSFDVFDTLLLRPFWKPKDMFALLNDDFNRLSDNNALVDFCAMRADAERNCRKRLVSEASENDDITIDDIYERIAEDYGFDKQVLEQIKLKELSLEKKFCYARRSGKQLFELAKQQGKKVIICSDIYLPHDTIASILQTCGYRYDALYLSSETKKCKSTGKMFGYVSSELAMDGARILHIGDNFQSDVIKARQAGWMAFHLPRSVEVFSNSFKQIYTGNFFDKIINNHGRQALGYDWDSYTGLRCAFALVANKIFDFPFAQINLKSDLNCDPYFLGYFAVGQYLYAVTDWIAHSAATEKANKLHFVARDGYLPMKAYEMLREYNPDLHLPPASYLYVSRKSTMLADVYKPADIYSVYRKMNLSTNTPEKLVNVFRPFFSATYAAYGENELAAELGVNNELYKHATFSSRGDYFRLLSTISGMIDYEKLERNNELLKKYFGDIIGRGDVMFDLGYTGRQEAALTGMLGFPVNGMYMHANTEMLDVREQAYGFRTRLFYDYRPAITGVVREHVFMKKAPSTIGYKEVNGHAEPAFEKYKTNGPAEVITEVIQNAALEFVRDMLGTFDGYLPSLAYRKDDLTYAFEYYLHYSLPFDRKLFDCVLFEDDFGLGRIKTALDSWRDDMELHRVKMPDESPYKASLKMRVKDRINAVLPKGSKRREQVKKLYYKLRGKTYVEPDFFASSGKREHNDTTRK